MDKFDEQARAAALEDAARIRIMPCPECCGTGDDLEDSSKDCYECHGSGVVRALAQPAAEPVEEAQ